MAPKNPEKIEDKYAADAEADAKAVTDNRPDKERSAEKFDRAVNGPKTETADAANAVLAEREGAKAKEAQDRVKAEAKSRENDEARLKELAKNFETTPNAGHSEVGVSGEKKAGSMEQQKTVAVAQTEKNQDKTNLAKKTGALLSENPDETSAAA